MYRQRCNSEFQQPAAATRNRVYFEENDTFRRLYDNNSFITVLHVVTRLHAIDPNVVAKCHVNT